MASQTFRMAAKFIAIALASASTAALAQAQPASADAAPPATTVDSASPSSTSDTAAANQASQDIVITGIRGSLDKSVRIKRELGRRPQFRQCHRAWPLPR